MLKVEKLTKVFKIGAFGKKYFSAVSEASFIIKKGEIVSLIGESGSGKTTIGKMILKLSPISSGQIFFEDEEISDLKGKNIKEYYRKVQGIFQDPFSTFNPVFKADRIFNAIHREFFPEVSQKNWENKLYSCLKSVGLNPLEVINKFPHQLSGGQLQRLLIARVLLLEVKLLIADEIISMLDASTRIDVLNLIAELRKSGLSVLFITHDLSLGYYISDKAIILYKGFIVEMGKTEKVFNNPVHPYTQILLDSVPRLDLKWEAIPVRKTEKRGFELFMPTEKTDEYLLQEYEEDHFVAVKGGKNV